MLCCLLATAGEVVASLPILKRMDVLLNYWPAMLAALLGFLALFVLRVRVQEPYCPYERRESLLTRNEQTFYAALRVAVQDDWDIFAMVRLADLIRVIPETQGRQTWQNRINCKHVDFVLCDHYDLRPLLAIEVDDRSHRRADRVRRDEFLDDAMEAAQLPLLRIEAARHYAPEIIRQKIDEYLPVSSRPKQGSRPHKRNRSRIDR
ncbi:MAG: DUF2726 domain-containing protein [Planctomycetales bacterium]|nr:DUF2726 domain-containing protein [Planctomycetales bacterium]